jgi:hypothetical protein
MEETQEQFLARKASEQKAVWVAEHQAAIAARRKAEERAVESAKSSAELDARLERFNHEQSTRYTSPESVVVCSVCGGMTTEDAVCHTNGADLCVRDPYKAKLCGRISKDAWDMLTEAEKSDGYIIQGVAGDRITDYSTGKSTTSDRANLLQGNVINSALRR